MTSATGFIGVSPRLPIRDLERTIAFYEDLLGFEAGDPWPEDDPSFVLMRRDNVVLQFILAQPNEPVGHVTISLNVDDAMAIHQAIASKVAIEWGPEVYWYGRREFSFRDPDGYALIISAETSDPVTEDAD
ncbi:MAG TPA: VOC family protein [Hyphomonadaceae bacterium]|nr:VOC family protein [Hyphomonadaceae bacterium]